MQVIGNELVVSLEVLVGNVEENGPIFFFGALTQDTNRALMAREERRKDVGDQRFVQNGGKCTSERLKARIASLQFV